MSDPSIAADPVVEALVEEWSFIGDLLAELSDETWSRPSCLPGWSVHDIAAHILGTESMLAGADTPPATVDVHEFAHVGNDIAAVNEHWVLAMRNVAPPAFLSRYADVIGRRTEALRSMSAAELDAPSWTPIGQSTYRRFMQIRLFDCWMHEQDIRDAIDRPGHEDGRCAEESIDELVSALGFIVGKRAGAPEGSAVTVELTGPVYRVVNVTVEGRRASVVSALDRTATTTLRLSSSLFARLAGGRVDAERLQAEVAITGDLELGRRIAADLAVTF